MILPNFTARKPKGTGKGPTMTLLASVTADQIVISLMATIALREALILVLPDRIAGPQGWLIVTDEAD